MVSLNKLLAKRAFDSVGFELQEDANGDLIFVRPCESLRLYERVEIDYVGRKNDAVVVGCAVSLVENVANQCKGLVVRGGLEDYCTEPDDGRVRFASLEEQHLWLERLTRGIDGRFAEFTPVEGERLLKETESLRADVDRVYRGAVATGSAGSAATQSEQAADVGLILKQPLVMGPEELATYYKRAVTALVLMKDDDVRETVRKVRSGPPPDSIVTAMQVVPIIVIQKVRLLVDRMLRARKLN